MDPSDLDTSSCPRARHEHVVWVGQKHDPTCRYVGDPDESDPEECCEGGEGDVRTWVCEDGVVRA